MPTLEFTLMVGCPLKCTYCPQDKLREQYGAGPKYFSYEEFRQIIDKVPPHVRIDFSGMAEPWAHPKATEMLRYALEKGRTVAVYTTLYGMVRPDEVAELLVEHRNQIAVVCIHLPDANGNMRGWKISDEWRAAHDAIMAVRSVLPRFEIMTMDAGGKVHPDLGNMRIASWAGNSRAANISEADVGHQPMIPAEFRLDAVACGFTPFYDQNVVLPSGDVVLCCMDYSLKHRIGNLLEQDYYDIFAGAELGRMRADNMQTGFHVAGQANSLCRTCDRAVSLRTSEDRQFWIS